MSTLANLSRRPESAVVVLLVSTPEQAWGLAGFLKTFIGFGFSAFLTNAELNACWPPVLGRAVVRQSMCLPLVRDCTG